MEYQTQDSYRNLFLNNFKNNNFSDNNITKPGDFNKNLTSNINNTYQKESVYANIPFETNLNYLETQINQRPIPLSLEDKNSIILSRIILSIISLFACLICIMIYFYLMIKRIVENKKENQLKEEKMNQMDNGEDLDEMDEKADDKKERFLTYEDIEEEEKIENKKGLRFSLSSRNEKNETVSFENVIEQNKSVSFDMKVYNPYSSDQSK